MPGNDHVLSAEPAPILVTELDHAEDRQYVRRRVRRDPGRHGLDDDRRPRRRAFRAHNQDIDYVTIRNLVIRNMPQKWHPSRSTGCLQITGRSNTTRLPPTNSGILFPNYSIIRNNYIHHNVGTTGSRSTERGGGYGGYSP